MAIYRVDYHGHLIGTEETFQYGLHLNAASGSGAAILTTAQEAGTLLWQGPPTPASSIQQLVPTTTGVDSVVVNELDALGHQVAQNAGTLVLAGTAVTESLPPHVAVAISTRTTLPTRRGRGRFFLPAFAVPTVLAGLLTSTARGQVAAACKASLDHFNAGGWQPVIWHKSLNTFTIITAIDVGNVFDVQSRRRRQITEVRTRLPLA